MNGRLMCLVVAGLACAALLASGALGVTFHVSVAQAAADLVLAFAVFVAIRAPGVWWSRRGWAREEAARNKADADKWRELEQERYERSVTRRSRRRRTR